MDTFGIPLEYLWESVADGLSVGLSIHSTSGEIKWANKKLSEIYGKPLLELLGSNCKELFHGENWLCPHDQVVSTGVRFEGELSIAGRVLSLSIEPLLDEANKARGFVRILTDITDERRSHEQLLKAERFATLGQILSGIAHDVGTPLNVISGYAEYLLMRIPPEGQGHKELSAILYQTRRIAAMFVEALDLSRPAQGRRNPIEIQPLLIGAVDLAAHSLRKEDIKIQLTCTIEPPLIYGEASQFRQAFFNLLVNAGHLVGVGARLETVIQEAQDKSGYLMVALWGTDAAGAPHDFSQSLRCLIDENSDAGAVGMGISLAQDILNGAGAIIRTGEAGERGVPLMIYLPVSSPSEA